MATVAVIVPGAGSGTRFGGERNKIFQRLGPQPVFLRTLECFTSHRDVAETVFVASAADLPELREEFGGHLRFLGVKVVEGGASRTESVRHGLAAIEADVDLIAVHDAARPCLARPWLDAVFTAAERTGAAMLATPIHGTIKRVDEDRAITATLPREHYADLWEARTPQVFRADWFREAYAAGEDATDDAALVERLGHRVHVVPCDARNVKITTPEDLEFARQILPSLPGPTANL
jgi:2-C-methyl-D-erythritol 4-phosphate cytidylyltransferase